MTLREHAAWPTISTALADAGRVVQSHHGLNLGAARGAVHESQR